MDDLTRVPKLSRYSDGLRAGRPGTSKRVFVFSTASRPALRSIQPFIQWVTGALSPGFKRLGLEANHSPPSIAEVKKGVMPPLPHRCSRSGA
jgi:hypothetical protein